jgi:hypothetical protein
MKKWLSCVFALYSTLVFSQNVAINNTGSSADNSAMLDVQSTDKGLLIPRMTSAERSAISSPATGLLVFQSDGESGLYYYDGSNWIVFLDERKGWSLDGNAGTDPVNDYVGTSDNSELNIATNGVERLVILPDGRVGLTGDQFFVPSANINVAAFGTGSNSALGASVSGVGDALYGQNISSGIGVRGMASQSNGIGMWAGNINGIGTGLMAVGNGTFAYSLPIGSGAAINGNPIGTISYGNNPSEGWGILAAGNDLGASFLPQGGGGAFTGQRWGTFSSAVATSGNRAAFVGNYNNPSAASVYLGANLGGIHYKVFGTGGGSVSTTMNTREGEKILFAPESPENWFFDIGEVELINGEATVQIDPLFLDCISTSEPFKVMVQGAENTLGSIQVIRDLEEGSFKLIDTGGESNGIVIFQIYGIWKGKEGLRFPSYEPIDRIKSHPKVKVEKTIRIKNIAVRE